MWAQTKHCVHQDSGERNIDPSRGSQTCLWVSRSSLWRCWSTVASCGVRDTGYNRGAVAHAGISPFKRGCHYHHHSYHSLAWSQTIGRENSHTHQQKIELKINWAWSHPQEQDQDSTTASPSHQESSTSLLSLSIRGQTEWKSQSQKTNQTNHLDHSLL